MTPCKWTPAVLQTQVLETLVWFAVKVPQQCLKEISRLPIPQLPLLPTIFVIMTLLCPLFGVAYLVTLSCRKPTPANEKTLLLKCLLTRKSSAKPPQPNAPAYFNRKLGRRLLTPRPLSAVRGSFDLPSNNRFPNLFLLICRHPAF